MSDVELTRALERGQIANGRFHHASHLHVAWVYLITLFWVHLLAQAHATKAGRSLEELVQANPQLLEKDFPLAYYSAERLFSDCARTAWVEPDLKPLSLDAIALCSSNSPRDTPNRALSR